MRMHALFCFHADACAVHARRSAWVRWALWSFNQPLSGCCRLPPIVFHLFYSPWMHVAACLFYVVQVQQRIAGLQLQTAVESPQMARMGIKMELNKETGKMQVGGRWWWWWGVHVLLLLLLLPPPPPSHCVSMCTCLTEVPRQGGARGWDVCVCVLGEGGGVQFGSEGWPHWFTVLLWGLHAHARAPVRTAETQVGQAENDDTQARAVILHVRFGKGSYSTCDAVLLLVLVCRWCRRRRPRDCWSSSANSSSSSHAGCYCCCSSVCDTGCPYASAV